MWKFVEGRAVVHKIRYVGRVVWQHSIRRKKLYEFYRFTPQFSTVHEIRTFFPVCSVCNMYVDI